MTQRVRENLISGCVALGSLIFLIFVIPAYTPAYPGYGVPASLMPNFAVGLILVLSLLSMARNLWAYRTEKKNGLVKRQEIPEADRVQLLLLARYFVPCVLLLPAMQWIGFIPAGIAFLLVIQYLCGQRKPVTAVVVALMTVGAMYAVMRFGLSVPMP